MPAHDSAELAAQTHVFQMERDMEMSLATKGAGRDIKLRHSSNTSGYSCARGLDHTRVRGLEKDTANCHLSRVGTSI